MQGKRAARSRRCAVVVSALLHKMRSRVAQAKSWLCKTALGNARRTLLRPSRCRGLLSIRSKPERLHRCSRGRPKELCQRSHHTPTGATHVPTPWLSGTAYERLNERNRETIRHRAIEGTPRAHLCSLPRCRTDSRALLAPKAPRRAAARCVSEACWRKSPVASPRTYGLYTARERTLRDFRVARATREL